MAIWIAAALVLMLCLVPCGIVCLRGDSMDRLVALETAGMINSLTLLILAEGFQRIPFVDLALAMALLTFAGGLVFARFVERWL
jgi:multicomponent Na+:H+ antiporter subunit F